MFVPVSPIGDSNWSIEIRKLQDEVKRLKIKSVVNGEFIVTSGGTSIVCGKTTAQTGSAIIQDSIPRWI